MQTHTQTQNEESEEEIFDLAKLRKMEEAKASPSPYFQLPLEQYQEFSSKKSKNLTSLVPVASAPSKFITFRACSSLLPEDPLTDKRSSLDPQLDTGLYFKFNCSNEIKLVRGMLEETGFTNIDKTNH